MNISKETVVMTEKKTWEEFRNSGLLWWVNRTLHLFGWAITISFEDGVIQEVFPSRVKFRGFTQDVESEGYVKLTSYMAENVKELLEETNLK